MKPKIWRTRLVCFCTTMLFICLSGIELTATTSAIAQEQATADTSQTSQELEQVRGLIKEGKYAEAEGLARELLVKVEATNGAESLETAEVLDALVEALWRGGKASRSESRELAERAVEIKEKILGSDHLEVAQSLNNLANLLTMAADYSEAKLFYKRVLAIREKELGPDHLDVAKTLNNLAVLLYRAGDYAEAKPLLERALAISENAFGPYHPDVAAKINNLAVLLQKTGDYAEARSLYERVVAIEEKTLGSDHPTLAAHLNNLASLLMQTGDYTGARPLYERALAIREKVLGLDHTDVAQSLHNLAALLYHIGDYAGARPVFERALAIEEKSFGPNHPEVAASLDNLATLLYQTGDYAGARPLIERALAIREKHDLPAAAESLHNLAEIDRLAGDYVHARQLSERALAIREQSLGPNHNDVAESLHNLAKLYMQTGDYVGARSFFERALAISEKALGPSHPDVAKSLNNLAGLYMQTGNYAEVRSLVERVVAISEKSLGPYHPLVAESQNNLARVLLELGEFDVALDLALQAETIGRDHLRLTASTLAERQALRYASVRASGLDLALSLAATDGNVIPSTGQRVWDALIRSRAIVLDEMATRNRTIAGAAEISRLAQDLVSARERLANLTVRGLGDESPERYRKLLDDARMEKEQAERALAEKSVAFQQEQAKSRIGFSEVASALAPNNSALVAFALYNHHHDRSQSAPSPAPNTEPDSNKGPMGKPEAEPSYLAFVLRVGAKEPITLALGSADEIETLISQWGTEAARGVTLGGRRSQQAEALYRETGEALRQRIWDPIALHLQGVKQVFVVPDGELNLVSLAALSIGESNYLVESDFLIHYFSAERDLVDSGTSAWQGKGLLAFGAPAFDATSPFAALTPESSRSEETDSTQGQVAYRGARSDCGNFKSLRFRPLPASAREVEEITNLWKKSGRLHRSDNIEPLSFTGANANEMAFKEKATGRKVVHLATHGFFLGKNCPSIVESANAVASERFSTGKEFAPLIAGENPLLLSGLALAGANHRAEARPDEEDGILTAEEIAALNLSGVEWAVLSACETGVGEIEAGEGVFGLRRAFQVAGARTLIMSLWSVEDEAAQQWMTALYEARLVQGMSTAESVRTAGLKILRERRKKGQSTHPFYWAAFVAAGDWR